jgi:spore coat-associated protein N
MARLPAPDAHQTQAPRVHHASGKDVHMSRLQILASQPRLALGALLTLALASAAIMGSGADFTASSASPGNTFSSGTLSMTNSKAGVAVLTASGLKPGAAAQLGTVDIANTGSLSGVFKLYRGTITDTGSTSTLSPKLNLIVTDCGTFASGTPVCGDAGDVTSYTGTLAGLNTSASALPLGTFAAGEKHRYQFSVALDSSADNNYQGGTSVVDFTWTAS